MTKFHVEYPGQAPCPACFESSGYVWGHGNDWNSGPWSHQTNIPCNHCNGTGTVDSPLVTLEDLEEARRSQRRSASQETETEMTKVGTLQVTDGCEYDRPGEWVVEEFGYGQHDEPSWVIPGWFEDRWGESGFFPSKAKAVEFMKFLAA